MQGFLHEVYNGVETSAKLHALMDAGKLSIPIDVALDAALAAAAITCWVPVCL